MAAYFAAYGPTTIEAFGNWLAGGWFGKRRLRTWFEELRGGLAEVEVDGEREYVLAEHLDELASTQPTAAVRLLPGFDQYVLGPGTADGRVVPPSQRSAVSRQAGWISPVVVAGGSVRGTWRLDGDCVEVAWFADAGRLPRKAVTAEVARLSAIVDRELRPTFSRA
jgi:hypothetical protein